ncbi:MAG: hypothetical protein WCS70_07765 [Verrucomicrobiota bacterium]
MKLTADAGNAPKIQNDSANLQTIASTIPSIVFDVSGEINPINGNLTIGSNIILDNSGSLSIYGNNGKTLTFNGAINNGSGASGHGVILKENSIVIFNASNGYTGETDIDAGELRIGSGGAINSGSAIYLGNGGQLTTTATLTLGASGGQTFANNFTVNTSSGGQYRNLASSATSGNNNTFGGVITLNGDVNLVAQTAGGTNTFSGQFTSTSSKVGNATGPGVVVLSGTADNVNFGLNVTNGTVVLAKTSSSGVHAVGGWLTITNAGNVQLAGSGGDQIFDSSGVVINNGGTFALGGQTETVSGLTNNSGGTLMATGGVLLVTGTTVNAGLINIGTATTSGTLSNNNLFLTGSGVINFTNASGNAVNTLLLRLA